MKRLTLFITALLFFEIFFLVPDVFPKAPAETIQSLAASLDAWDVEKAWSEVLEALQRQPRDPEILDLASHIAFHRGEYRESLELIKQSMEAGGEDEGRRGLALFIEQTIHVLAPYKRYETPHFIIHLEEERDGILIDYLSDALEKTYGVMARHYGFSPGEKVRVELFPDANSFYLASAFSVRDIEFGAVGLTKYNKLQFLSPRALLHGYRWLDAISHEYVHYLIVRLTSNKAPIWFHEGLAKYEETRWRAGPSYLSPLYRTLLSRAQADRSLIGFARMEPSLVHLETPDEVQLAYAQAASAIEFIIERVGLEGIKKVMDLMSGGKTEGAGEALKAVMGLEFPAFEEKWTAYLASKDLKPSAGAKVRPHRIKEEKADEERLDLEEIRSLAARNRAHLGDRLKETGRLGAAVMEYRGALEETRDSVPVMTRLSTALVGLGRDEEAGDLLKGVLELAPDHPLAYTLLGRIHAQRKDFKKAGAAFEESIQINPFNPYVHAGLAQVYAMLGETVKASKEQDIASRLTR